MESREEQDRNVGDIRGDEKDTAQQLRDFLAGRNVPCPQCQYNLRDLRGCRCPECGEELILRVNLAEPKIRLLIAGLIGLSAGAGMSGLLLVYMLIQIAIHGFHGGEVWNFLMINAIGLFVEGGVMAVWLRQWRRIRRAPLATRVRLMILCWVLTGANILLFSLKIR